MESVLLWFVGFVYISSVVIGWVNSMAIDFLFVIKYLSNPYYHIGISFMEYETEDPDFIEQEIILGLFFIEFMIVFYKERIEA